MQTTYVARQWNRCVLKEQKSDSFQIAIQINGILLRFVLSEYNLENLSLKEAQIRNESQCHKDDDDDEEKEQ